MSFSKYSHNSEVNWYLLTACLSSNPPQLEKIQGLLDGYAESDAFNSFLHEPAIISAIRSGNEAIAEELAKRINGLNVTDKYGLTPLMHAVNAEMDPVAKVLIERGADLSITDNTGQIAKDYLTNYSSEAMVELFTEKKEEPEDEQETLQLFDMEIVEEALDKESNQKRKHYLRLLHESGDTRSLSSLQESVIDDVTNLKESFPNFGDVIDFYLRQLALINLDENKTIRFIPILMSGPPGVGKTRFAKELSKTLNTEFHLIACSTVSAGFVISGGNTMWESGRPGLISDKLRDAKTANPIIQLDEIDKISGDQKHNPYGPLYSLLENETAKMFMDEALEISFDASNINWVATANNLAIIPEPILSRFVVINVASPSKQQMRNITQSIYNDVLESFPSWGHAFNNSLHEDIVNKFVSLPPRKIRQLMIDACGRAAERDKDIEVGNIVLTKEDIEVAYARGKASVGFVS